MAATSLRYNKKTGKWILRLRIVSGSWVYVGSWSDKSVAEHERRRYEKQEDLAGEEL